VIKPLFLLYGNGIVALVNAEVGDDNLRIVVEMEEGVHLRRELLLLGLKDLLVLLPLTLR
jgi:hypothetical protein